MSRLIVQGVSKSYPAFTSSWRGFVHAMTRGKRGHDQMALVLENVSFRAEAGESVAILGRNGAGKSTLLKIVTGVTLPSNGTIELNGRATALIELGLGLNTELTGRENAALGVQLQGLRDGISELVSQIEDFAELGAWFDEPVWTYSSGMHMRLAFSIAVVERPEVLVIDEAFAVGDLHFQHKCTDRLQAYRRAGTSVIFVSHDLTAVKRLCDRAILLQDGRILRDGPTADVADYYFAMITQEEQESQKIVVEHEAHVGARTTSGLGGISLKEVSLLDAAGGPRAVWRSGEVMTLRIHMCVEEEDLTPCVGFMIKDRLGTEVFGMNTQHLGRTFQGCRGSERDLVATFKIPLNLGQGSYSITIAAAAEESPSLHYFWSERVAVFQVLADDSYQFEGICRLPVTLESDAYR